MGTFFRYCLKRFPSLCHHHLFLLYNAIAVASEIFSDAIATVRGDELNNHGAIHIWFYAGCI